MKHPNAEIRPPSSWFGFLIGASIICVCLYVSYCLFRAGTNEFLSAFITFPIGFYVGVISGVKINKNRRKIFADRNGYVVRYSPNQFGNGEMFVGYYKAGEMVLFDD